MTIAHVIGYFQPEFGYKEFFLAKHQAKLGHDVHVITSDRIYPFPNIAELIQQLNLPTTRKRGVGLTVIDGFTVHRLPTIIELGTAILVKGVSRELAVVKPDLIIIHGPIHVMPALAAMHPPQGARVLIEDQQFELPPTIAGKLFFFLFGHWLCQAAYRKADVINFVTPQTESFARKQYTFGHARFTRIPLGFDPETFFVNPERRRVMRHSQNIADDECVFISAGKLQRGKNLELLLRAYHHLPSGARKRLYIVGSGDPRYIQELQMMSRKMNLQNEIHWQPFVQRHELADWYNMADVGIWTERPSITILEAIGCGLPLILPDYQTVAHLVASKNGRLFRPGSEEDLAQAMKTMLSGPGRASYQLGIMDAQQKFSYVNLAKEFIAAATDVH